ncbi:MAG: hypothetical protein R2798_13205 [Chitinophagales bacterium]|nr:tetratricopeptide repeat protein [Bacteroidota bacterium]
MSQHKQHPHDTEIVDLEALQGRSEQFFEENKKLVIGITAAILLVAFVYFYFTRVYIPTQEEVAQKDMFMAQQYFAKDSFNLALNGDGNYPGFKEITQDYSSFTNAVNLANYYAGISYLRLKDYDSAIESLGKFKGKDMMVGAMALGALGDAYAEKGDMGNAISYYKKAAAHSDNEFTAPIFLQKAAEALEVEKKYSEALSLQQQLKDKYPNTAQGRDADKYIARLQEYN